MKDKIITIGLILLLLAGIGSLCYPMISNLMHDRVQDEIRTEYDRRMEERSDEEMELALEGARKYNEELLGTVILTDPFDPDASREIKSDYFQVMNLNEQGIMGYVEIPRIDVYEPIYHGTSEETLAKGVGHLENTSIPVGGVHTHAVLSGHTGMVESMLFTELDSLEMADIFLIHILNDTLAYQVDQIKVVEPSDTSDLHIDMEQDYVTLVTCTPYGINSHRLLVRGTRVEYTPEVEAQLEQQRDEGAGWDSFIKIYGKAILEGLLLAAVILAILSILSKGKKR